MFICNNHIHNALWKGRFINENYFMDKALTSTSLCIKADVHDCEKKIFFSANLLLRPSEFLRFAQEFPVERILCDMQHHDFSGGKNGAQACE